MNMIFDLKCSKCKKNVWRIMYDPNHKETQLTCANCGKSEMYEEVIGIKRRKKNATKKTKEIQNTEQVNTIN